MYSIFKRLEKFIVIFNKIFFLKFQVNQAKYANETSVAPVNKRKSVCLEDESIEDPLFAAQVSDYSYILVSWG